MTLYESILERLRSQHLGIFQLVNDLQEEDLREKKENEWSMQEHLVHLAVYQPRFVHRLQDILNQESPEFEPYIPHHDPLFQEYLQMDWYDVWLRLVERRDDLIRVITALQPSQLQRIGIHARYGKMTLLEWIEFFLLHESHHTYKIFMLRKQVHQNKLVLE